MIPLNITIVKTVDPFQSDSVIFVHNAFYNDNLDIKTPT